MKTFFNTIYIQLSLFGIVIIPIIILCQILIHPLWETAWCGHWECHTMEHHLIYSREEFRDFPLREKQELELYEVKDKYFNINYYFLRTNNKIEHNDHRLVFSTGYFSKKNAQRDLELIKNNDNIEISKKNVGLITTIALFFYMTLMFMGVLTNFLIKSTKENSPESEDVQQRDLNKEE